jgi:GABA(A) receptor-associated protein
MSWFNNGGGSAAAAEEDDSKRQLAPGEAARMMTRYPDKIPVVVKRAPGVKASLPALKKWKYAVPRDLTMGQFMFLLRRHMSLPPEEALFLFIANTLVPGTERVIDVWSRYREEDGALHVIYSGESAFGNHLW